MSISICVCICVCICITICIYVCACVYKILYKKGGFLGASLADSWELDARVCLYILFPNNSGELSAHNGPDSWLHHHQLLAQRDCAAVLCCRYPQQPQADKTTAYLNHIMKFQPMSSVTSSRWTTEPPISSVADKSWNTGVFQTRL